MRPFGKVIGCRRPRLLAEAAIQWIKIRKNAQFFGKLNWFFFCFKGLKLKFLEILMNQRANKRKFQILS